MTDQHPITLRLWQVEISTVQEGYARGWNRGVFNIAAPDYQQAVVGAMVEAKTRYESYYANSKQANSKPWTEANPWVVSVNHKGAVHGVVGAGA